MKKNKWLLPVLLVSTSCFANQRVWLVRCVRSDQTLSQLNSALKQQGINVLNSVELSDKRKDNECSADEKLQAVFLASDQKLTAQQLTLSLRDAPEGFKPLPGRRFH
jgi:hypothetical protein